MKPRVTFDHNCIVSLEENRPAADYLRPIVKSANQGELTLGIPAIMASENQKTPEDLSNFQIFIDRLDTVKIDRYELLLPIGYWGVAFFDQCLFSGESMEQLEREIHAILFPKQKFESTEKPPGEKWRKWKNRKCDVLSFWCHVWHGGGIFVTDDGNFHKETKKAKLELIAGGAIAKPRELRDALDKFQ